MLRSVKPYTELTRPSIGGWVLNLVFWGAVGSFCGLELISLRLGSHFCYNMLAVGYIIQRLFSVVFVT
ncbi:hypothetical protein BDV40DRAFT_267176 [Aspergillus tamarii]|uniref:Uncharacterized protein n=1 Tax=Aspergillus tamarii TaxID=41984 RepID=A0A5N6USK2_ASPTM|nr:hypothetical protein BDV40DRAFT_267176 [Aspergillus tamarii]